MRISIELDQAGAPVALDLRPGSAGTPTGTNGSANGAAGGTGEASDGGAAPGGQAARQGTDASTTGGGFDGGPPTPELMAAVAEARARGASGPDDLPADDGLDAGFDQNGMADELPAGLRDRLRGAESGGAYRP